MWLGMTDHEMGHRHREALVQELHASEQAYLQSLEDLSRIFEKPLRKDAKSSKLSFLGMKKLVCTERETRWLFCNMDDILQVHQSNLANLNERYKKQHRATQHGYTTTITMLIFAF